jgi:predicted NAD/FAD-binding protein
MSRPDVPTVAVVGAGVAGLTAAYLLSRTHAVTVYEAAPRFGGHAHTHDVTLADGRTVAVDSGFIVHNERTYPHLLRLFRELGVATQPTEMSMSITCEGCGLSYAGGRGLAGIFAQQRRVADHRFLRMLTDVPRFHRAARSVLANPSAKTGADGSELTWAEFLEMEGFSPYFVRHFAVPLVAGVWSSGEEDALGYPAHHLFAFLEHHGMLSIAGSPQWRTVTGGSGSYVRRVVAALPDVRASAVVTAVERHDHGVDVRTEADGLHTVDRVVLATPADEALDMLVDATPEEKNWLGAVDYSANDTVLHRDATLLPAERRARASWNYRLRSCGDPATRVMVSYWMNRLHGIPAEDDLVVTLNGGQEVDPAAVVARMQYRHPVFTPRAVAAGARLRTAGGKRLAFAGAHLGWGFHEDGCRSGVEAAARWGATW